MKQISSENNDSVIEIHDEGGTYLLGLVTKCLHPCLPGLYILMVTVPEEHGTAQVMEKHPTNVTHTTHVLHCHLYLLLTKYVRRDSCACTNTNGHLYKIIHHADALVYST